MEIVRKLEARAEPGTARLSASPQDRLDREVVFRVDAEVSGGDMKKRAAVTLESPAGSTFEIVSDEGAHLGGEDTAPPPLSYFSAAIAF
jgi:hypothetical protein